MGTWRFYKDEKHSNEPSLRYDGEARPSVEIFYSKDDEYVVGEIKVSHHGPYISWEDFGGVYRELLTALCFIYEEGYPPVPHDVMDAFLAAVALYKSPIIHGGNNV